MGSRQKPQPIRASDLRESAFEAYSFLRDQRTTLKEQFDKDLGRIRARAQGQDPSRLIEARTQEYNTALQELGAGANQEAVNRYYELSRAEVGDRAMAEFDRANRNQDVTATSKFIGSQMRRQRERLSVGERAMGQFMAQDEFLEQEFADEYTESMASREAQTAQDEMTKANERFRRGRMSDIPAFAVAKQGTNPWT